MLITLVVFILILGLLIFVHELGHFLIAKRSGIKVEEFAFGFPPRLIAWKRGETEYALNLLPFGGYVKMLGEEEDASATEKKNSRSFAHQSVWVRAKVVVAGVIMNFILAWLLLTIGFTIGMPPLASDAKQIPLADTKSAVVVTGIARDSVAEKIGLLPGDTIVKINDETVTEGERLAARTKELKGQPVKLEIERDEKGQTIIGVLGEGEAPLGIRLGEEVTVRLPFWWAPFYAVWETVKAAGLIFVGIIDFFRQLITTRQVPAEAAGPVGIFYYTRNVLELGLAAVLNFVAVLSINLGVINILPIPALDGGRLLFILLEKFNRGKKLINQRIENIAHMVGFALLMLLILSITYSDILKLRQ